MQRMIATALCLLSLSLAMGQHLAQKTTEDSAMVGLENAWNQAEMHHDVKTADAMMADSFVYVDGQGRLLSKAQYLAGIGDKSYDEEEIRNEDLKVVMYGDTAIVTSAYTTRGADQGKPFVHHGRFVDVWVKLNGKWLCVSSQETRMTR